MIHAFRQNAERIKVTALTISWLCVVQNLLYSHHILHAFVPEMGSFREKYMFIYSFVLEMWLFKDKVTVS